MFVVFLFLLIGDLVSSTNNHCQPIPSNFSLCFGIGYTQMYLPNLLNHESISEILYEFPLWQLLVNLKCHPNTRLLLCSILAPVCLQEKRNLILSFDNSNTHQQNFVYPCRTLCKSVQQSCEPQMIDQFNYKWPTIIDCNQFPNETELCVSYLSSTTSSTPTTLALPTTTIADVCSMCQSEVDTRDLLSDYCQSEIVILTRPMKISSRFQTPFIFANKHKVRYFKGSSLNETISLEFPLIKCSCVRLNSPLILFISSTGKLLRFISIEQNPNTFHKFRNSFILRKPRC